MQQTHPLVLGKKLDTSECGCLLCVHRIIHSCVCAGFWYLDKKLNIDHFTVISAELYI